MMKLNLRVVAGWAVCGALAASACAQSEDGDGQGGGAAPPESMAGNEASGGDAAAGGGGVPPIGGGAAGGVLGGDGGLGGDGNAPVVTCQPTNAAGGVGGSAAVDALRGGPVADDDAVSLSLDDCGNLLVAGRVGGEPVVRSYDAATNLSWTSTLTEPDAEIAVSSVLAQPDGISFVLGSVNGVLPGDEPSMGKDVFVRKLDAAGHVLGTYFLGSADADVPVDAALGDSDSLFLLLKAGQLPSEAAPPTGELVVVKVARADAKLIWSFRLGSDISQASLAADGVGNSYVLSGSLLWILDSEGREAVVNLQDLAPPTGMFDADNDGPASADSIAASADGKQIYVAGGYGGDDEFEPREAFVAALGPTGNQLWMSNVGFANGISDLAADSPKGEVYGVGLSESWPLLLSFTTTGAEGVWGGPSFPDDLANGSLSQIAVSAAGTATLGFFWQWTEEGEQLFEPWVIARGR